MKLIRIVVGAIIIGNLAFPTFSAFALAPDELKTSIQEKTKALQDLNSQIQETQKNLTDVNTKGKSLKNEIKAFDYRINQLGLVIKAKQLTIDRYNLEINSLENDIVTKKSQAEEMQGGITSMLRELQTKDHENMLMSFLKNRSLAEAVAETQSLEQIGSGLSTEVERLTTLRQALALNLDSVSGKRLAVQAENQSLKSQKATSEEERVGRQDLLVQTKNQEKIYQDQLKELEKQQAAIADEIDAIEKELRSKVDPNLLPTPRPGVVAWPVLGGIMSQGYGHTAYAAFAYKSLGQWHNGVDIAAPSGTPIIAAEDGKVVFVGNQDKYCPKGAYGKITVIEHPGIGLVTFYGHQSAQFVTVGQTVKRGDVIGAVGRTGWATGNHLHFVTGALITYVLKSSKSCGLMPYVGDIDPTKYLGYPPTQ